MPASVVMTVLSADRPGLVRRLSEVIAAEEGNWLESRMSRLAGQFAGILRVECPDSQVRPLLAALDALSAEGISIQTRLEAPPESPERETIALDVVGNDRPGIILELTSAIASAGGNLEDLHTSLESAPMSGHPIFHARGEISLPADSGTSRLVEAIERIGSDLSVSVEA